MILHDEETWRRRCCSVVLVHRLGVV